MSRWCKSCSKSCIFSFLAIAAVGIYVPAVAIICKTYETQLPIDMGLFITLIYISTTFVVLLAYLTCLFCKRLYANYTDSRYSFMENSIQARYIMDIPNEEDI